MSSGVSLNVTAKPLSTQQKKWLGQAWAKIDREEIVRLVMDLTNILSLPGREKEIAQFMVSWMHQVGLKAFYQPIDDTQGNAIGMLRGSGGGPDLLLWGELDMLWGIEGEDRYGMGDLSRPELQPNAWIEGDYIIGLGAGNPKGHTACAAAAVAAIRRANIPLKGNVILGFPGGGMSMSAWDSTNPRKNIAHGIGCDFMLQQGIYPDFAIAAKPVYAVSWEEAGFCWFKVMVKGSLGYAGTRHLLPYNNAIINASKVIEGLEKWFPEYARRNASGLVAPQGFIGAIEGGCAYKPLISPELCTLYLDLRISPDMTPGDARRQLDEALRQIQSENPGLELDCEMILSIAGSRTDPTNWIVESCIRGWEFVEGQSHVYDVFHSGATDVNILRARGVPVARLGIPLYDLPAAMKPDLATGMSTLRVEDTKRLIKCFIYSIIDTCTRTIDEVGLSRN